MNVLDSLTGLLPAKAQPYAKTVAASLMASLNVVMAMVDVPLWVKIAVACASAPVVFAIPNKDPQAEHQDESVQPPFDDHQL